jgi:hypothetical protein
MGNDRVFLDINIGNVEENAQQLAEYQLTDKFLKEVGSQVQLMGGYWSEPGFKHVMTDKCSLLSLDCQDL